MQNNYLYHVAVIGAGPAGLFAARELSEQGAHVVLFNRDIKPGGLAEYGIYPTKLRMKEGLRHQFRQVLALDSVEYYGNVLVGDEADLSLDDLRQIGFHAILVTVGAQSTKWLGLPGENLKSVYHAKDIVYHYNLLPPYSESTYQIGKRVAVVGVGNVMSDIAHWLIEEKKVDEVIAIARRGPAEIKFDRKELENFVNHIEMDDLYAELKRVTPQMQALNQDPVMFSAMIKGVAAKAPPRASDTRFKLLFLSSPARILGDESGNVTGLEVENTILEAGKEGEVRARGTGTFYTIEADTVIFAIGDQVDSVIGLPVQWGEFVKNPSPRFPIDGVSYEAYDPETNLPIEDVFLAGWARKPSTGLVGIARKDGVNAAHAMLQYLEGRSRANGAVLAKLKDSIKGIQKPVVTKEDVLQLEHIEQERARLENREWYKFGSNQEMLDALGIIKKESEK
jgi:ferredoxin/flavodoxin---NADP+ reductase